MDTISTRLFSRVDGSAKAITIFFWKADVTTLLATLIWCCALGNTPLDLVIQVLVLEIPDVFWQFSLPPAAFTAQWLGVTIVAGFEWSLSQSAIVAGRFIGSGYLGLVYNTFCSTMLVEGAILGLSTVTCTWSLFWGRGQGLGIVAANDGSHVVHTAVYSCSCTWHCSCWTTYGTCDVSVNACPQARGTAWLH